MMMMDNAELKERGYCIPIYRAIKFAGGAEKVAEEFGIKTGWGVRKYYHQHQMPKKHVNRLCEMGGNRVKPDAILKAMKK